MRILFITALLISVAGCGTTKKSTSQTSELDGSWVPVQQEIGGNSLPPAAFSTQSLIIKDSNYVFTAESVDKGIASYHDGKMDIYGKEGVNTGKHFMAVYKLENGQLSICYNLKGDSYPLSFDTKGKPLYFLCVFRKGN